MEDTTESDPREVEAASWNLNYVQMDVSAIYLVMNSVTRNQPRSGLMAS